MIDPEQLKKPGKLTPGDIGVSTSIHGSSYEMREPGLLDDEFLRNMGKILTVPKISAAIERYAGPRSVGKILKWAKQVHEAELKKKGGLAQGDFLVDLGNIVRTRKDMFDQYLGAATVDKVIEAALSVYNQKKARQQRR